LVCPFVHLEPILTCGKITLKMDKNKKKCSKRETMNYARKTFKQPYSSMNENI
jgi:hypothetical protein